MNLQLFFCYLFIFSIQFFHAGASDNRWIRNLAADPDLSGSSIGICIADVSTGKTLVSLNPGQLLVPASTQKTMTTAAALEILGPGYCFKTTLGYTGSLENTSGTLNGDLVIKGGGDPSLGSDRFHDTPGILPFPGKWMEDLKKKRIKTVTGEIVIDISAYDSPHIPGSWAWEDVGNYYGAGACALSFYDNQIRLFFDSPGITGSPVQLVSTNPETPLIKWKNELRSSSVNRDLAFVYGSPWDEIRIIRGTIPIGRENYEVKASMPNPPAYFATFLLRKLKDAGVLVRKGIRIISDKVPFTPLSEFRSPSLAEIVREVNYESVNLYAEHLVYQIAFEKKGLGVLDTGLMLINRFWENRGVPVPFYMKDGSGLSRYNAVSAKQLTEVLLYMQKSTNREVFRSSLPSAGEGTLAGFRAADFPGETLRCKSGSMERVRGYCGYLKCNSGKEVAFSILVNNFSCTQSEMGIKIRKLLLDIKKEQ